MTQSLVRILNASVCFAVRGVAISSLVLAVGCARSESQAVTAPDSSDIAPSAEKPSKAAESQEPVVAAIDWGKHNPDDIFETAESGANFEIVSTSAAAIEPDAATFAFELPKSAESTTFLAKSPVKFSNDPGSPTSPAATRKVEFKLPAGFVASPEAEDLTGLPTRIRCSIDNSEFALIPEGPFTLGTNTGPENAQPSMPMLVDSYYIGITEVRVGQYVESKKRIAAKGILLGDLINTSSPLEHPALGMQWIDAKNYASSIGCDLPTEAQWEKAARGPAGFASPWGNSRPLWTEPRTIEQIDPVGRHAEDRSVFGVYDLAGNALEWTADLYQDDAFKSLGQIPLERRRNWSGPKSSSSASQRVVKGGAEDWAAYARRGIRMTDKHAQIGFRLVLNLSTK